MNGLALVFPVVATRKLSCASLRLATIASATPTPMTVATTRHESASTSRLEDHPLTPKVAQDPLSGGTRPPSKHDSRKPSWSARDCVSPCGGSTS